MRPRGNANGTGVVVFTQEVAKGLRVPTTRADGAMALLNYQAQDLWATEIARLERLKADLEAELGVASGSDSSPGADAELAAATHPVVRAGEIMCSLVWSHDDDLELQCTCAPLGGADDDDGSYVISRSAAAAGSTVGGIHEDRLRFIAPLAGRYRFIVQSYGQTVAPVLIRGQQKTSELLLAPSAPMSPRKSTSNLPLLVIPRPSP